MINILRLFKSGHTASDLHRQYGVSASTIRRWANRWADEADFVDQLRQNKRDDLSDTHREVMAVADASHKLHDQAMKMATHGVGTISNARLRELLVATQSLEDDIRALEQHIVAKFAEAATFAPEPKAS